MINIFEDKSQKNIGGTSLFITMDRPTEEIISIIKSAGNAVWLKSDKLWEVPINKLSYLINKLTFYDDIDLSILPDKEEVKTNITQSFKTTPFKYQVEGIDWMLNHPDCLLLDAPGLGKTLQIIYLFEELHARGECEKCLIICGINSLKTNWKKEVQKHSKYRPIIIGEKVNSKGKVSYASVKERAEQLYQPIEEEFVILNVESIRDNLVVDAIRNSANKFDLIVVDEVHKCSSPTSQQSKGLLKLRTVGKRHIGLTGTLLVNNPLGAYLPLKFIGKENSTFTNFKSFYAIFEQKFGHNQIVGYKNIGILKDEIDSCSLRRDKSLLDLPPKVIVPEYIDMDTKQQKFYEDIQKGVVEEADRVNIKTTSLLGLVTRLRQASTCPEVLTSNSEITSCKIERALELIEEITDSGEKVVVFSSFKEPLNLLYEKLCKTKPGTVLLGTGDVPDDVFSSNIDRFQTDDKCKIFLATTQKSGTGITLTAASYEVFLDEPWTAALCQQAEDRCWRIGSNKSVTIYRLICNGTIDERVQNILKRKQAMSDFIIDDKETTEEDLKELLGIEL